MHPAILGLAITAVLYAIVLQLPVMSSETLGRTPTVATEGKFAILSHGRVRYIERGEPGQPVVILVHGLTGTADIMLPLANSLALQGYHTICVDLYGRGYSESPAVSHTDHLFVSQLAELVFRLELRTPLTMLGVSMGGLVSARFAHVFPDLVQRLVLCAPAGLPDNRPPASRLAHLPILGELVTHFASRRVVLNTIRKEMAEPSGEDYEFLIKNAAANLDESPVMARSILSTLRNFPLGSYEWTYRDLGRHQRPILLIWGDDDGTVPYENAQLMLNLLPQARLETLHGARHMLVTERGFEIQAIVSDFLAETHTTNV